MQKNNAQIIVVKKIKKSGRHRHHGGAWKVAYADFVTAMMAFFLMMWLLNATTDAQRRGLADYFAPTISISPTSGGGESSFGGDSIFSDNVLAHSGRGSNADETSTDQIASGSAGNQDGGDEADAEDQLFEQLETMLEARTGESDAAQDLLRHIKTRVTDEGLVIEIFDTPGEPLFIGETLQTSLLMDDLLEMIASVLDLVRNDIAVEGHVASKPIVLRENPNWDLTTERAQVARQLLERGGLSDRRVHRVTGHADRETVTIDPLAVRNNRMEIIVLRSDIPR